LVSGLIYQVLVFENSKIKETQKEIITSLIQFSKTEKHTTEINHFFLSLSYSDISEFLFTETNMNVIFENTVAFEEYQSIESNIEFLANIYANDFYQISKNQFEMFIDVLIEKVKYIIT
jgi:hypothetical protein